MSKRTKTAVVKAPVVVKNAALRSLIPVSGMVTRSMAPDYLYQNHNKTLNGCIDRAVKSKSTKLKIDYNKMFG
jgi:hypothetical protein